MATTWSPRTTLDRRSWLLANGEVVQEPSLEETPSGRKVRVAGTTYSVYASDVDNLVLGAVRQIAEAKSTAVWMPLNDGKAAEEAALGYNPATEKARLHVIHDTHNRWGTTKLWWRFKHPTLPIEAVLSISVENVRGYNNVKPQAINTKLVAPPTTTPQGFINARRIAECSPDLSAHADHGFANYDVNDALRELIRDNPPTWDLDLLGSRRFPNERIMVDTLLKQVRSADALPSIQIPDLRDGENPDWLHLDLYETNCNDSFITELVEYLDGAPSVDKALAAYREMLAAFRQIGVVLEEKEDNDFLAALLSGDKKALQVKVSDLAEEGHQVDHTHTLSVHLPTGTFVVECNNKHASQDEIAEKWEEAVVVAKFTGKEDELLAYAREYARGQNARRTKNILKERKTGETA